MYKYLQTEEQRLPDMEICHTAILYTVTHTHTQAHTNTENQGQSDLFTDPRKQHEGQSERKQALLMCILEASESF